MWQKMEIMPQDDSSEKGPGRAPLHIRGLWPTTAIPKTSVTVPRPRRTLRSQEHPPLPLAGLRALPAHLRDRMQCWQKRCPQPVCWGLWSTEWQKAHL